MERLGLKGLGFRAVFCDIDLSGVRPCGGCADLWSFVGIKTLNPKPGLAMDPGLRYLGFEATFGVQRSFVPASSFSRLWASLFFPVWGGGGAQKL